MQALSRPARSSIVWLLLLASVVVACTSEEPPRSDPAALERLLASVETTRAAGTARMSQTLTMTFPEGSGGSQQAPSGSITVDVDGYLDLSNRSARLRVTTEGSGLAGADALAGDTDVILVGGTMYMRSPFYQQLAPNHEPWLEIDYAELGVRGISQLGQQDPLVFVDALRGVYGEVAEVGSERVREGDATHYRATANVERLTQAIPRAARASVEASFTQLGIEEMPLDVWLDDEGRLVRMTSQVELSGASTEGGTMELSLDLFEFGVAFDLRPPPADQVVGFGEVFGDPQG
jgi:hypothetical protein